MLHGTLHVIPFVVLNTVGAAALSIILVQLTYIYICFRLLAHQRTYPPEVNVHVLVAKGEIKPPSKSALTAFLITSALALSIMSVFVRGLVLHSK